MSVYNLGKRRRAVRPSPLFLAFVAATVLGGLLAWTNTAPGSRVADFGVFVFVLGGWVVSVCLHEFAHAFIAFRAGDREVETAGYLTLNPFKYAHPVLSVILPLLFIVLGGIGLPGGAVYLHPHTFRRRWQQSAASAAGPVVNVGLAIVLLLIAKTHRLDTASFLNDLLGGQTTTLHGRFWAAVAFLGFLQVTAALLNLLPIPGLDGWGIIEPYLDPQTRHGADKIKPWGMIGVIVLLQFNQLNARFFDLAQWLYERTGANYGMADVGRHVFQFWVKSPW
jgi:Zn-dependent protease